MKAKCAKTTLFAHLLLLDCTIQFEDVKLVYVIRQLQLNLKLTFVRSNSDIYTFFKKALEDRSANIPAGNAALGVTNASPLSSIYPLEAFWAFSNARSQK